MTANATNVPVAAATMPKKASFWQRLFFSDFLVLGLAVVYFLAVWPFRSEIGSATNLSNLFLSTLPLLILAAGQTFVLVTGGIDLSVTAIIAVCSVAGGKLMTSDNGVLAGSPWAVPIGVLAMVAIGAAIGLFNGLVIVRFNMPPFIVTLTGMMFFGGFAIWSTKSQTFYGFPKGFVMLGQNPWVAAILTGTLVGAAYLLLARTRLGAWTYAVGHNAKTSLISGVPVRRTTVLAYVISGLSAAFCAILLTAKLETGSPEHGKLIFLDVIGAAEIGGTSLFGGKGSIRGTAFGVLFISLVDNSLNLLDLSHFTISMVKGSIVLLAALVDAGRTRLQGRNR